MDSVPRIPIKANWLGGIVAGRPIGTELENFRMRRGVDFVEEWSGFVGRVTGAMSRKHWTAEKCGLTLVARSKNIS